MLRRVILQRGAFALESATKILSCTSHHVHQRRLLCQSYSQKKPDQSGHLNEGHPLPEAPPFTIEDLDFIKDFVREEVGSTSDSGKTNDFHDKNCPLPEPPAEITDWTSSVDIEAEDEDDVEDITAVPYLPPDAKSKFVTDMQVTELGRFLAAPILETDNEDKVPLLKVQLPNSTESNIDVSMLPVIEAWARAVAPTPASGPMPLHELANRSTKIKELVKLGVDMSKIVERHGDMERLLHLSWEEQIKPHLRFLVDVGVDPDNLGAILTRNTKILWTDIDDMQVRINYLHAKKFTADDVKKILRAPFWLTLPTKEIDHRLGFLQRSFKLTGNEVRQFTSSFPAVVSSGKWKVLVDSTKLMDRQYGFNEWERKELLVTKPQCYLRSGVMRKSFDYCHNEIGLTHLQLVRHPTLLVERVIKIKPRHQFLKFLKRDIFDVVDPKYISPDWLWQGSIQDFCEQAAKTTVEEYELFLKHSAL